MGTFSDIESARGAAGIAAGSFAKPGSLATGALTMRLWDSAYKTTAGALKDVPGTTIAAVTKIFTVPAGYMAWVQMGYCNYTGSPITLSVFAMANASTPAAADRMWLAVVSANNSSTGSGELALDEGGTLWAFASVNPGLDVTPYIMLIPKPVAGGVFTASFIKDLSAVADIPLATVSTAGNWAQCVNQGIIHNTTAGTITLTTKLKRAADPSAFVIGQQAIATNANATFLGGQGPQFAAAENGDTIYATASATGLNLGTFWCERPKAGYP
jgi:hypothetical protein